MPTTLSCFYAIYTEGESLNDSFPSPSDTDVFLGEMETLVRPTSKDELFGPYATIFQRVKPTRGFLLGFKRKLSGRAENFFSEVRTAMLRATAGAKGVGLDILKLAPFPLQTASEVLPEDLLAEDLFSVGFTQLGDHGMRAETMGFAKLGQREVTFEFTDPALMEEAALMCGHLADWLLDHAKRITHGQSMTFGFDRITFFSAEGDAGGPFRGWHPPLIQKLMPEALFPGVGVLEVRAFAPGKSEIREDLTVPLRRALEQRTLLEEFDLTGDAPHAASTAQVKGFVTELKSVVAIREESQNSKDSGWRFRSTVEGDSGEHGVMSLGDIARRAPELVRFLALPLGVKLAWNEAGTLEVDRTRVELDEDELADDS